MRYNAEQMKSARVGVIGTKRDKDGVLIRYAPAVYLDGVTGANTAAEQWGTRQLDYNDRHHAIIAAVDIAAARGLPITEDVRTGYPEALHYVLTDELDRAKAAAARAQEKVDTAQDRLNVAEVAAERILKGIKS